MANQLVLDIPYKSICSWMQERRLLPPDWVMKLKAAQIKSEQLRQEFPSNHNEEQMREIRKKICEDGENFLYKDAKEVFQMMIEKTEEGKQKSLFGRYKSPIVYEWQVLLRIYEADNLYLAQYGKVVQQLQGFDLPATKKQLQTSSRQVNDSQQKQQDLKRSIREQDKKFNEECAKLGIMPTIEAQALERQAIKMVEKLVPKFQEIESLIKSKTMRDLVEFYKEFNAVLGLPIELRLLSYMVVFGDSNLTVFEARTQDKLINAELQAREQHKYDLYQIYDSIVYQDQAPVEITLESSSADNKVIDLDWSQIDTNYIDSLEQSKNESWALIDDQKVQEVKITDDPAKYHNEETLLYNQETRLQLINDLEEVDAFLRSRLTELQSKDQTTFAMYLEGQARKEILKQCDQVPYVKEALANIEQIQTLINHKDILQLILMRQKPKIAAQRLLQKLLQPVKLKEKYESTITVLEKKQRETTKEVEELRKEVERQEKIVKELSSTITQELSTKLKATVKIA